MFCRPMILTFVQLY